VQRSLRHLTKWLSEKHSRPTKIYRWFQIWIGLGLALAILLLVSSISTYVLVSRRMIVDHLRRDLASQVAMLDQQVQRGAIQNPAQFEGMLRQMQERSNGRIAWIQVRNGEGTPISQTGSPITPSSNVCTGLFSNASTNVFSEVVPHTDNREQIFKTLNTDTGRVLVDVFPFRLPGTMTLAGIPVSAEPGRISRQFGTIEIGAFLAGESAALWPLKRNLTIDSLAALALFISLLVIALRLRSYVADRQLEQEVEIARGVQRDLLPSSKRKFDGFELASDCVPAARVGGDFFDTFSGRGSRTAFVLGDVSGKGVPAALLMGVIHGAVRSSSWAESPAHHTLATQQINRLLYERAAAERFATMFWSYFDPESQHLKYINAGHCPPLLLKAAHRNTLLSLNIGGPALGLLPDAQFQQGSVRLEPGDILVLYSDGIVEGTNSEDEEFGEQRVRAIVTECRGKTAEEIRDQILASVEAFTGRVVPEDDRTLCVIVYLGMPARVETREAKPERAFAGRAA
jgi:hypothetical protein